MRVLRLLALWSAAAAPPLCQIAPVIPPELPKDPRQILAAVEPLYNLDDAAMKPWHLQATYQFYDKNDKPTEQGTWEYWWDSPRLKRMSWTRAGAARTDWISEGKTFREESGETLHYFERSLYSIVAYPLQVRGILASKGANFQLKTLHVPSPNLTCVSNEVQGESHRQTFAHLSPGPDYYCFEPSTTALRLDYSNLVQREFSQIARMQGHYLARQIVLVMGGRRVFSVTVERVNGIVPSDARLTPPADARIVPSVVTHWDADENAGKVDVESLALRRPHLYSGSARMEGIQGNVFIGATIGTDGKVRDIDLLFSPNSRLTSLAIDAVKAWEYRPYLVNGTPVEVETILNVWYHIGPETLDPVP
jgi:TonB family protein